MTGEAKPTSSTPEAHKPARGDALVWRADRPGDGRPPLVYSVEEAADLLGIGRTFMFQLIGTGEVESIKIGKLRKIPHDAIDGYIKRLRAEQVIHIQRGEPASSRLKYTSRTQPTQIAVEENKDG
ncbi:MAG TPA: excisionase family DNA-binding protein [Streptosporangiaceae bacterium]|nr:excisionase family DNA-binding protein [Streptosporangiaceae bacterium]